jgi:hypothetical protein
MKGNRWLLILAGAIVGGWLGWKAADVGASLYFLNSGIEANGWTYSTEWSVAEPPSLKAAAFAKHAMMANTAEEAVYYFAFEDSGDDKRYVIHFEADELPDVNAFWSLTMYHGFLPYNLVKNSIDRFVISNRTPGIQFGSDGSLDIYIQNAEPGADERSNWLPAPDGAFMLLLRTYWPGEAISEGRYAPPSVTLVEV